MASTTFSIFPEFKGKISDHLIKERLNLVSSVITFSKGHYLDSHKIKLIRGKLGEKLKSSTLCSGGSSVLFCWGFPFQQIGPVMFKPYYARELSQLLIHYLSIDDFFDSLGKMDLPQNLLECQIRIPRIIGIAKIEVLTRTYPLLLAEEVKGESIKNDPPLIKCISRVALKLAQKGIICDPYPANWLSYKDQGEKFISYIDLLSSNTLTNVNERISALIKSLQ